MDKKNIKKKIQQIGKSTIDGVKTVATTVIDTSEEILKYYDEHKRTINRIGLILLGTGAIRWTNIFNGGQTYDRRAMSRDEYDRCYYDPRTRHYVYARRPLSKDEEAELYSRGRGGELYRDILYSMHLLG